MLTAAFSSAAPSFHPVDLLIGIAGAVIIRLVVYSKQKNAKKYRKGMEYGTARWGTPADIKPFIDPVFENTHEPIVSQIDKIIVHDFSGAGSSRTQKVEIHFNFVGEINLAYTEDELKAIQAEKEAKELAKREAQKERGKEYRERKKSERYAANEGHKFAKRICEQCGKEYWPTRPSQKYCSKECGRAHEAFVRMNRDPAEKEGHKFFKKQCVVCGKEFWPSGPNSICCSDECRKHRISIRKQANYDTVKRAAV